MPGWVMPTPREATDHEGVVTVGPLEVRHASGSATADAAVERLRSAWPALGPTDGAPTPVTFAVEREAARPPVTAADEGYRVRIDCDGIFVEAVTEVGARRAVESLLQLADGGGIGCTELVDAPKYPWRGLLLDVCRHWIDLDGVLATIEAMAVAKLNVLHLHLSDDQAFRLECRARPRLHEVGSGGSFFTHDDIARIVGAAHEAGIQVVPELDVPGHVTSWLVGHPELAATPGPFELRRTAGIANVALDPTNPLVHETLEAVFAEVAELFPDPYFHIGGDEVDPAAWPGVDAAQEQRAFTDRVAALVRRLGRIPIVWDEAWHPGLAPDVVVQVWRGHGLLGTLLAEGRPTIFSSPYYLDLAFDPGHHRVDPDITTRDWDTRRALLFRSAGMGPLGDVMQAVEAGYPRGVEVDPDTDRSSLLGGEACMWTELCPQELLPLRLWPSLAAVADTLWAGGPDEFAAARPVSYDRFVAHLAATTSTDVELVRRRLWSSIAEGDVELADAIAVLASCCESIKWYSRHLTYTEQPLDSPFDRFVDGLPPRATCLDVAGGPDIDTWQRAAERVLAIEHPTERQAELRPVAERLVAVCTWIRTRRGERPPLDPIGDVVLIAGWRRLPPVPT